MDVKNGRKTNFGKKNTSRICRYPAGQNFVVYAVSHTVYEINAFLRFTQKFKMADQKWRENYVWGKSPVDSAYTLWVKNFVEIILSSTVIEINAFYAEIQDGRQKWQENYSQ